MAGPKALHFVAFVITRGPSMRFPYTLSFHTAAPAKAGAAHTYAELPVHRDPARHSYARPRLRARRRQQRSHIYLVNTRAEPMARNQLGQLAGDLHPRAVGSRQLCLSRRREARGGLSAHSPAHSTCSAPLPVLQQSSPVPRAAAGAAGEPARPRPGAAAGGGPVPPTLRHGQRFLRGGTGAALSQPGLQHPSSPASRS